MAEESTLRQRKPRVVEFEDTDSEPEQPKEKTPTKSGKKSKKRSSADVDEEGPWDGYTPYIDVLRVITFLLVASCGLSYVISGGESWFWGTKHTPDVLTFRYYKELITGPVESPGPPPRYMDLEELATYDGIDAERPVYLAINGTVFDVSNGRRIYGPGGPYHHFAGTDAARGFVTGCFQEDRTADLRGVETMFLPIDDPETDAHWSAEELAELKVKELERAKEQAHKALAHWMGFFTNNKKYSKVGYLTREENWLEKEAPRKLCDQAQNTRKKRKIPKKE
ncbi:hypothetical protein FZEAL_3406 [Fusarium zealandicum]|uniref:Cytochrome b5 heme-binding domain-containing protein n=1 Tax=Fusarium zealandicum TaxID=1053134 RepID=A0A8H4UPK3_9HYPO|nr:hypothetical protein FZEAL_3406 [Fusarium zealandicum]